MCLKGFDALALKPFYINKPAGVLLSNILNVQVSDTSGDAMKNFSLPS